MPSHYLQLVGETTFQYALQCNVASALSGDCRPCCETLSGEGQLILQGGLRAGSLKLDIEARAAGLQVDRMEAGG